MRAFNVPSFYQRLPHPWVLVLPKGDVSNYAGTTRAFKTRGSRDGKSRKWYRSSGVWTLLLAIQEACPIQHWRTFALEVTSSAAHSDEEVQKKTAATNSCRSLRQFLTFDRSILIGAFAKHPAPVNCFFFRQNFPISVGLGHKSRHCALNILASKVLVLKSLGCAPTPAMAVSGTFHANADHNRTLGQPDIVLSSRDHVLFYAHTRVLNGAFSSIPASSPVPIPESSDCVNILLHTIYNLPAEQYNYPLPPLFDAIQKMSRYGIDPKAIVVPSNALYRLLTLHVPYQPLFVYAVAGYFGLENLAVQTSGHLLTIELESISEELAELMGTSYYRRLFLLHENRMETLQRILNEYPEPPRHNPCHGLPVSEGKTAWIDAGLDMITNDVKPSLSPHYMRGCIIPFARSITCPTCAAVFESRLTAACQEWSQIKCTI